MGDLLQRRLRNPGIGKYRPQLAHASRMFDRHKSTRQNTYIVADDADGNEVESFLREDVHHIDTKPAKTQ